MPAPDSNKTKYFACGEIMPDCSFTATGATEEELMKKVAEHGAHVHGIIEVPPELATKVKAAIKER